MGEKKCTQKSKSEGKKGKKKKTNSPEKNFRQIILSNMLTLIKCIHKIRTRFFVFKPGEQSIKNNWAVEMAQLLR